MFSVIAGGLVVAAIVFSLGYVVGYRGGGVEERKRWTSAVGCLPGDLYTKVLSRRFEIEGKKRIRL